MINAVINTSTTDITCSFVTDDVTINTTLNIQPAISIGVTVAAGVPGPQGPQGLQGDAGPQGLQGDAGADGDSAYEVAVSNGFVGTEVEWLASLDGTGVYVPYTGATDNVDLGSKDLYTLGNVGVGTTSPSAKLDVVGKIALNDGGNSVFIGEGAGLNDDATDNRNVGIGSQALTSNTTGSNNVANGNSALRSNTTGGFNVANGIAALYSNTTGGKNTANGYQAGRYINSGDANETSTNSVYVGNDTRASTSGAANEIVIGSGARGIGSNSVVLGNDSITTTNLKGDVGIGTTTPSAKLDVSGNIKLSETAATTDTDKFAVLDSGVVKYRTGTEVLSDIGAQPSLTNPVTGTGTTNYLSKFTGTSTLGNSLVFDNGTNVGIGTTSPSEKLDVVGKIALNDGGNSVFVGQRAGLNDDGTNNLNVGIGYQALLFNTTGSSNTAIGYQALRSNTTGDRNTANGVNALYSNTTGGFNVANGTEALFSNTTGGFNVANGRSALFSNTTGSNNTVNGYLALYSNTTGSNNTVNGYLALYSNTTGGFNVANGYQAGRYTNSGGANETSTNSVYVGYDTRASTNGAANEIVIGYNARGIGSNSVVLGNDSITTTNLKGNVGIGTTSPTSRLDVAGGDIELDDVAAGIIMRSPDGTKYRITVANGGTLTVTAV